MGGLNAFVKMYPKHFEMGTVKFKQGNITFTKLTFLDPAASYYNHSCESKIAGYPIICSLPNMTGKTTFVAIS